MRELSGTILGFYVLPMKKSKTISMINFSYSYYFMKLGIVYGK